MQTRFGHDFSKVRIHADRRAAEATQSVDALAFTVGRDVVFGSERYQPNTRAGQRLLAHELAHVVARHAARGPFGIAGYLGGLIPEPTLVEGLAVALDPTSRDELTPHQWARAAQLANVAPSLETLLGASFFGSNQALAYTLAGSFLGHVLETRGKETVREIYRRGDVVAVLGRPWKALETEWRSAEKARVRAAVHGIG